MGIANELDEAIAESEDRCKFAQILDVLEADDRTKLLAALDSHQVARPRAAQILTNNGHPVSDKTISAHVNGDCRCP